MSDGTTDQVRGRRQNLSLGRLFLDPNNFRFFDHPDYRPSRRRTFSMSTYNDALPASYSVDIKKTSET